MNASAQPKSCFKKGAKVQHGIHGPGSIASVDGDRALVVFENGHSLSTLTAHLRYRSVSSPTPANDNATPEPAHDRASPAPADASRRMATPPAQPKRDIEVITPSDWDGKPVPEREWYIDDLIPMRQVTILYGDGGTGKSLLALQVSAAGAMGVTTLEMAPRPGRAFYLGAEDEAEEFHRRLIDITNGHGRTLANLSDFRLVPLAGLDALLSVPDRNGTMTPTPLWKATADYAREFRPQIMVMDTVADLFGGDEIKRGQARQFVGMLKGLAIEIDCAVILLAHPSVQGMQSGTGSSGSTGWSNSARSRLYLTRPDSKDADSDLRILKTMKSNYGTIGAELKMKWHRGAFVLDDGKPAPGSAMIAAKAERVFRDVLSALNRSGERVAKTKGVNYAPKIMAERPDAEGVTAKQLEAAMQRLLINGEVKIVMEGPPTKLRQRLILTSEDFGPKD